MKQTVAAIILGFIVQLSFAQSTINPAHIDIVRDSFGVPHIFAKTDAEVAYGLAWAHSEDDFKIIQQGFLAGKSMLGLSTGKQGAIIDFVVQFTGARELVNAKYESDISPQYKAVLQGYCDGFNAYAKAHPKEVLVKKLLPLTPKDMLTYSVLQLFVSCGGDNALQRMNAGSVPPALAGMKPGGSNGYAFNSHKTADSAVYLSINSHQPLEGPVSWYEAHLCSEEGWNIIGALFACAPSILVGCNENLGWGHTVNNPDKLDIYQLEINPENKLQYKLDDHWETLEEKTARMRVKVAGITVSVKRKIYRSKFGPTIISKNGTFSLRTPALFDIRALEQWYWMNKAKNFTEFYAAMKMNAIPGYNAIYGDRFDTIYYISNAVMPLRDKAFNWKKTLPGNTSKTLWTQFHPISDLPQVLNPSSGYLFNSNHSPFNATAPQDNIKNSNYDPTMGYETHDNNRSIRFMEQIAQYNKVNWDDFKKIKYDLQLPKPLAYSINGNGLFQLDESKYPDLAPLITTVKNWDRLALTGSKGAAYFGIIYYHVVRDLQKTLNGSTLSEEQCVECYRYLANYLQQDFGTTEITLGDYQRLVRGDKTLALPGLPDVIASMSSGPYKNGRVKGEQGESYIELVHFTSQGPEIESINSYGASNRPGNKHYDDQMDLFVQQHTKKMTLNKNEVYKKAERIYHPE